MLGGTDRDPTMSLMAMAPSFGECTLEKVAIAAVMAGCLPEYMPVVVAIVEAEAGDDTLLASYSDLALDRVWKAERFSYWMTTLMHVQPDSTPFIVQMQLAELRYLCASDAPAMAFAENYTGLPYAIPLDRIVPAPAHVCPSATTAPTSAIGWSGPKRRTHAAPRSALA